MVQISAADSMSDCLEKGRLEYVQVKLTGSKTKNKPSRNNEIISQDGGYTKIRKFSIILNAIFGGFFFSSSR